MATIDRNQVSRTGQTATYQTIETRSAARTEVRMTPRTRRLCQFVRFLVNPGGIQRVSADRFAALPKEYAKSRNDELATFLDKDVIDVTKKLDTGDLNYLKAKYVQEWRGATPLHIAARHRNVHMLTRLLQQIPKHQRQRTLNQPDSKGRTVLDWALERSDGKKTDAVLEKLYRLGALTSSQLTASSQYYSWHAGDPTNDSAVATLLSQAKSDLPPVRRLSAQDRRLIDRIEMLLDDMRKLHASATQPAVLLPGTDDFPFTATRAGLGALDHTLKKTVASIMPPKRIEALKAALVKWLQSIGDREAGPEARALTRDWRTRCQAYLRAALKNCPKLQENAELRKRLQHIAICEKNIALVANATIRLGEARTALDNLVKKDAALQASLQQHPLYREAAQLVEVVDQSIGSKLEILAKPMGQVPPSEVLAALSKACRDSCAHLSMLTQSLHQLATHLSDDMVKKPLSKEQRQEIYVTRLQAARPKLPKGAKRDEEFLKAITALSDHIDAIREEGLD